MDRMGQQGRRADVIKRIRGWGARGPRALAMAPSLPNPDYVLPVFTSNSWIKLILSRSLRLERSCAIERCIRRVQFKFAFVPGTLKRYLRASRSVIMTMASHDSLLKSASMIAG